ncbi:MAG TPA: hypothetical protein PLP27_12545, partial [Crocinitomicaceae bacterium]|nr:hypothetical protein [Crocinitomicaceae bacterium]
AEALVDLIDMGQTAVLTPLAKWKLSKKRGVKGKIAQAEIIAAKSMEGEELTAKEKRLLYQYNAYLESFRRVEEKLPYTEDERERLTSAAKKYVSDNKLKVSKGLGFWGELAIIQGTRILEVVTA